MAVNYRSHPENAQPVVDHLNHLGQKAIAVQADVFEAQGCERLVKATLDAFGAVDICIIGPGGGWHPEALDALAPDNALEDIRQEKAPLLYLMSLVLPGMYARGWGRVIGLASHPGKVSPAYAYNIGKAARMQAMLLAQDQVWQHGVTVNVIAPGPVEGLPDLPQAIEQSQRGPAWANRANVSPQDIAEGVAFLCSEAGRFINGCVMPYWFNH